MATLLIESQSVHIESQSLHIESQMQLILARGPLGGYLNIGFMVNRMEFRTKMLCSVRASDG